MTEYDLIVKALIEGSSPHEVADLLLENQFKEERIEDQMRYAMLAEQFLDQCSVYLYSGWDKANVYGAPVINSYTVDIIFLLPPNVDKRSFKRLVGKNKENRVDVEATGNGIVKLTICFRRGMLDEIEDTNRKRARKLADEQGIKPQEDATPAISADPMGGGLGDPMSGGMGGPPPGGGMF